MFPSWNIHISSPSSRIHGALSAWRSTKGLKACGCASSAGTRKKKMPKRMIVWRSVMISHNFHIHGMYIYIYMVYIYIYIYLYMYIRIYVVYLSWISNSSASFGYDAPRICGRHCLGSTELFAWDSNVGCNGFGGPDYNSNLPMVYDTIVGV